MEPGILRIAHRCSLIVAFAACAATAEAQTDQAVRDPPLLPIARPAQTPLLEAAPGARRAAVPGEAVLDLDVTYVNGRIWNPALQRFDPVRLRGYLGKGMDPNAPYVSPTLSISPGETIRITLNNKLPADPSCKEGGGDVNTPHCFNGTNLHTHGLWVNPAGNGDNVLISINPGVSFQYEYKIPPDHPAGTFWYHTHRHGSTAMQVSSGMAGAIVIHGNRPPTPDATGDLDTLLRPTRTQPFRERVLVLQQIQYACRNPDGTIKRASKDGPYVCDAGEVAGIEKGPPTDVYDLFGPGEWPQSGRYTTINGLVVPTFRDVRAGQVERWRVIHGGVRDSINLQFRKLRPDAPSPARLKAAEQDAFISAYCAGEVVPQHRVAADGLTLAKAMKGDVTVFQPGYRWDLLMVFPQAGSYCVIDAAAPPGAGVAPGAQSRQLLGMVEVSAGAAVGNDIAAYLAAQLAAAAQVNIPANARAKVVGDLRDGIVLASFVPHPDIAQNEVTGQQELWFKIGDAGFTVNDKPFDPDRVDRFLTLGGVDEWHLRSDFVSHPFHIHVNPFQVVAIYNAKGEDVSAPGAADGGDPQYPGLKGVWKDTLWIKNPGLDPTQQYKLVVRTRYQRYIGDYVLHCHILDHEDQGMMQRVRVALPDGSGGVSRGHH